jgi:Cu/Ag efflux pump CusA
MHVPSVTQLIPILQTAIGPTILISGIGLLLLTMTNRLGRVIDRARILAAQPPAVADTRQTKVEAQLQILWRRARLVRLAIALASMSALAAAILIIVLFLTALWQVETALVIGGLFILCMVCLIGSLIVFIHDINQSLAALRLELA